MTTYAVYEHKVFGAKAVKNGFSAGGFFFPLIWSLMHKIWWLAAVLFPWGMIAAGMDSVLSNIGGNGAVGALLAQFFLPSACRTDIRLRRKWALTRGTGEARLFEVSGSRGPVARGRACKSGIKKY